MDASCFPCVAGARLRSVLPVRKSAEHGQKHPVHVARALNAMHIGSWAIGDRTSKHCRVWGAQRHQRGTAPRDLLPPSLPLTGLGVAVSLCTWGCVYYCKKRRGGGAKVAPKV